MEYQQDELSDLLSEQQYTYASFWERFGASFIDGLVIMIINFFIGFLFGTGSVYGASFSVRYNFGGLAAQIVAGWLYCALQESSASGATLGKRALGIRVVNLEGGRISFGQATGRHFGKIISGVILLIGYLMMLWDERSQALHDKMAGTLVVNRW